MLQIQKFVCNMLQENCYVVADDSQECIIIDCGAFYKEEREAIVNYIDLHQLVPKHLVATHAHIDHNMGNGALFEAFGLKSEVSAADRYLMEKLPEQAEFLLHMKLNDNLPPVERYFDETDVISFGHHRFTIIPTPGHTEGSCVFYCQEENVAFSGDTLFKGSIGRVDLEGGSMFKMIQSIRFLSQLPDQTQVFPGHGEATTIGEELAHNPYMER